ncbi:MOSC domain-containing protein [Gilvimarinus sp. DA14]|uniref:MOSC domain-containing protein n=1 Tax=Gilvimarinus sp. DA14 TaxID=2956798 RepID=UPI0020B733A3|nr:MOSC N-terminal beta barrel domain-containing protein [Gilvimarinus sp. DA14]UTF58962.1 MOSC N-terminal beta barrel domain-containing protein [Gilvimarinus sp. DA14]
MRIGTIQSIWRYPVKGMAGESVSQCRLDATGLQGDRQWAVQDIKRREIQSCKFRPELLRCRAQTDVNGEINITFPSGEVLTCDDPQTSQLISQLVGYDSQLQALRPAADRDFYRRFKKDDHTWLKELKSTFEREDGEPLPDLDNLPPTMQEFVSLLGTFFLVSPFHLLTTASLNHMASLNPNADWHIERFRPNLVVATEAGIEGLAEQNWVGHKVQIGACTIECNAEAPRCGAVIRQQSELEADSQVLRSIVRDANQNLGVYGEIIKPGHIRCGDTVTLLEKS